MRGLQGGANPGVPVAVTVGAARAAVIVEAVDLRPQRRQLRAEAAGQAADAGRQRRLQRGQLRP